MAKTAWAKFPHDTKAFDYSGDKLARAWPRLHAGDCEPYPDEPRISAALQSNPKLGKQANAGAITATLQQAWRDHHRGEFKAAFDAGIKLGPLGASVAIKAGGIHASYLLDDEAARLARYQQLAELADKAATQLPDDPNAHYRRAFALGRYSQSISIAKALAQGLAGKVKECLDRTLKLAPKHAEAHTALGLYHAEIIDKVGAMIGGLTYGAKASLGEKHLQTALDLAPESPIAYIEYGNGLMLLYGDKREDDAAAAYQKAASIKPKDAMEWLDVEFARSQLE